MAARKRAAALAVAIVARRKARGGLERCAVDLVSRELAPSV